MSERLLVMDRSTKKEILTPQQVAKRAREVQSQGQSVHGRRNPPARQSASVSRVSSSPALSSSSLSPSILDYTRRTLIEAQAFRTGVRIAELNSQATNATRDDAVVGEIGEDGDGLPVYPGTAARRNVTVRRSRDRLSGRPQVLPRTPEDVLRRRPMNRPRDLEYEEQILRETSAVTFKRNHGEELKGNYRVVPYSQDDPDEGFRSAGNGDGNKPDFLDQY